MTLFIMSRACLRLPELLVPSAGPGCGQVFHLTAKPHCRALKAL